MILAIANQKGGAGKTTTAAALMAALQDRGRRVLGVDWDPQASLTTALGARPDTGVAHDLAAYIIDGEPPPIRRRIVQLAGGESLLPSHLDLGSLADGGLRDADRREYILADLLAGTPYDTIFIDCPPALGLLTVNALVAADAVLIPCPPEYLAVEGLERMLTTIRRVQRRLNPRLRIAGIIPTMIKANTHAHRAMLEQITAAAQALSIPVLPSIPDRISVPESAGVGEPVTRYAAGNGPAKAYQEIATYLLEEVARGN